MIHLGATQLNQLLPYSALVEALQEAFCTDWVVPQRHHHDFANPKAHSASTLLLMPAWAEGQYLGVKTVIVAPENHRHALPAIQGIYTLFDADRGIPLAQMDAPALTALRTAAASALAASFLATPQSRQLLMIGTGVLAPHLIRAHAAVRPIEQVFIWGRNLAKAQHLKKQFSKASFEVVAIENIVDKISEVDIISCATLSREALVFGRYLRAGQHLDLVGAYRPDMREADDEVIRRCQLFVDSRESAPLETGDLAIPIANGLLSPTTIAADLFELCRGEKRGRQDAEAITLFKSVGLALEDLAAAKLAYEKYLSNPLG